MKFNAIQQKLMKCSMNILKSPLQSVMLSLSSCMTNADSFAPSSPRLSISRTASSKALRRPAHKRSSLMIFKRITYHHITM